MKTTQRFYFTAKSSQGSLLDQCARREFNEVWKGKNSHNLRFEFRMKHLAQFSLLRQSLFCTLFLPVFFIVSCAAAPQNTPESVSESGDPKKSATLDNKGPQQISTGVSAVENQNDIEAALKKYLAGEMAPKQQLKITYDDLHGLHGGIRLSVDGTGGIAQETRYPGGASAGTPKQKVSKDNLDKLVQLLVEIKAWEQQVAERQLLADEAIATLKIETQTQTISIWEFYNEMKKLNRIHRVRQLLFDIAWEKKR